MSDIYGAIELHGERMMVEIKPHPFEKPKRHRDYAGRLVQDPFCARCGFHRDTFPAGVVARLHPEG